MRLIFIDMHCINFLVRPYKQIKGKNQVATYKHKFILDYAFENNIPVCNYISGQDSEIPHKIINLIKRNKSKKISLWEHNYVMQNSFPEKLNVIPLLKSEEIKSDDLVIGYIYKNIQHNIIKDLPGHKILMGNHFVAINNPINLDALGIEGFVNEIDLSDNKFVNEYIKYSGKYIVCPYVCADRFVDQKKNRLNKMMAIGTLSTCAGNSGYALYRNMFHTEWIQNMRKKILEEADRYPKYIDSYISYIFEDKTSIQPTDSAIIKLQKKIANKFRPWRQSKYMSFNMVDKFNEYAFFVCPEENVGMPGIGFVEGMACGTTYIGLDTSYYKQLGLVPGIHYITYDGSFEDLLTKIKYCQRHYEEIRKIGKNGKDFVNANYNRHTVATNLFREFEQIVSKGKTISDE